MQSLLKVQETLNGKRPASDALSAIRSTPITNVDPEFLLLMLAGWAQLSCRIGRPSEAETLLHRAKQLISDATHHDIRAAVLHVDSILADTTGNKLARETILRQIVEMVPAFSPRRKFYVWELVFFLSQQGRGMEADASIKELTWQCNEQLSLTKIQLARFVDAVETGRLQDASQLLPQIMGDLLQVKQLSALPWRYQALLKLLQQIQGEAPPPAGVDAATPIWLKVPLHLFLRQTDAALRMARLEAGRLLTSIFGSGFDSFNLVRAELAAGKWEGARRILDLRAARGNKHYLDEFFLARVEFAARNVKAAAAHFARVLKSIEYYNAKGRLDLELRLACELSTGDIVQLTSAAQKMIERARPATGPVPGAVLPPHAPQDSAAREAALHNRRGIDLIVGRSSITLDIRRTIIQFANLDAPVLITGETGTGKELVARALHEMSNRKVHPFIAVDCGSITETLLESELFGHERGSFTGADRATKGIFEEAGLGTAFLDEIGDISPRLQAVLLRVIETGEIRAVGSAKPRKINCRIVAATNTNLAMLAEQRRFRRDLLFRLQRLGIHVPALRDRRDDILLLTRHFLDMGRSIGSHATISKELREALLSYDWPGNVRELRNAIERMRLMHSDKPSYVLDDLDLVSSRGGSQAVEFTDDGALVPGDEPMAEPAPVSVDSPASARAAPPARERMRQPAPEPAPAAASVDDFLRQGKSQIRRTDRLRELFGKYDKLTRSEIIRILDISPNTATKDLKTLCDEGFIERVEPSASTRSHYFVLKRVGKKSG